MRYLVAFLVALLLNGLVYLFVPFYELLGAMAAAAFAKFAEPK